MNTYYTVTCLLAFSFAASALVIPPGTLSYVPIAAVEKVPSSNYGFNYAVNDPSTGDNKAQWETRHGDIVQGAYSLVEPDGNVRLVEYHADPIHGFNAIVKRTGVNVHSYDSPKPIEPILDKPIGPYFKPYVPVGPIAPLAPIVPIIDAPHYAPLPVVDYHPILPPSAPWVHLSGRSYGHKGNVVSSWGTGPISLDNKSISIKTKHY